MRFPTAIARIRYRADRLDVQRAKPMSGRVRVASHIKPPVIRWAVRTSATSTSVRRLAQVELKSPSWAAHGVSKTAFDQTPLLKELVGVRGLATDVAAINCEHIAGPMHSTA